MLLIPPRGYLIDYICRFSPLGNSSTASASSNHDGMVGPSYSLAVGTSFFVPPLLLFIFALSCLLLFSVSLSYINLVFPRRKCLGL